jgi:hypothetical protein
MGVCAYRNGSQILRTLSTTYVPPNAEWTASASGSGIVALSVNDSIDLRITNQHGSAVSVTLCLLSVDRL